jgi:hypothetical protein
MNVCLSKIKMQEDEESSLLLPILIVIEAFQSVRLCNAQKRKLMSIAMLSDILSWKTTRTLEVHAQFINLTKDNCETYGNLLHWLSPRPNCRNSKKRYSPGCQTKIKQKEILFYQTENCC